MININSLLLLPSVINKNTKYLFFAHGFLHRPEFYQEKLFNKFLNKNYIIDAPFITGFTTEQEISNIEKHYQNNVFDNILKYNIKKKNIIFSGHSKGGLDMCNFLLKNNISNSNLLLFEPVDTTSLEFKKYLKKYSKTLNCNKLFFCKFTEECILDCTPKERSELYFYNKINAKTSNKYEIDKLCHEDIQTSLYNYLCYCNMLFNKNKENKSDKELIINKLVNDIDRFFK